MGRGPRSPRGQSPSPRPATQIGRQLLHSRPAWVSLALSAVAVGSVWLLSSGVTAQASVPTVVSVASATDGVLGQWSQLGARSSVGLNWLDPGLNNAVYALALHEGYLYAGGFFDGPGGPTAPGTDPLSDCTNNSPDPVNPLNCIARLPTATPTAAWEPLGPSPSSSPSSSSGLNGQVDDLVVMNGKLYVGGMFDDAFGQGDKRCLGLGPGLNCLATWDKDTGWRPLLGGGVVKNSLDRGTLYEGVDLEATSVAIPSDGTTGGSFVSRVNGLLTRLEVGLVIPTPSVTPSPLASLTVSIIGVDSSGSPTATIASPQAMNLSGVTGEGGIGAVTFTAPPQITSGSRYVFALSGTGSNPDTVQLQRIPTATPDPTPSGSLVPVPGTDGISFVRTTGGLWSPYPAASATASPTTVPLIATYIAGTGTKVQNLAALGADSLIVGGGFDGAGSSGGGLQTSLGGLAKWSATGEWVGPGTGGFTNLVESLLSDGAGTVYVGGGFTGDDIGSPSAQPMGIQRMSGPFNALSSWGNLADGFSWVKPSASPSIQPGRVDAMALVNGTVYAGGYFTRGGTGSGTYNNLARWSGSAWAAVGSGLNHTATNPNSPTSVRALAADSERGLLYVGGTFNNSTSNVANYPCTPVIPGPSPSNSPIPNPDGQGPLRCVAVWDTGINQFIPFRWGTDVNENGVTGEVSTFAVDGRDVYVGGNFNTHSQGGFPYQWNLKNVGKWTWDPPVGNVNASASSGGAITITGEGFIGVPESGGVMFGSASVSYRRSSGTSITATVPCSLPSGTYTIRVDGVGGVGDVGTVAVSQQSCSSPPQPTQTSSTTSTLTPSVSPTPTPVVRPSASGPTAAQIAAVRQVRPDRVRALANGVPSGRAIVLVDGRPQRNDLRVWSQGMTDRTGPVTMAIRTQSSSGANQRPVDGSLSIPQSTSPTRARTASSPGIQLSGTGNAALTPMRVFLIPQPKPGPRGVRAQDLGYLMTDAQGRLQGRVPVRARTAGSYIVQINGMGADGLVRSINLPATVRAPSARS